MSLHAVECMVTSPGRYKYYYIHTTANLHANTDTLTLQYCISPSRVSDEDGCFKILVAVADIISGTARR